MQTLLDRLRHVKMLLIGVLLVALGVGLIIAGEQVGASTGVLRVLPFSELGGVLIGVAVLSIWIESLLRADQEASDELRIRRLLHEYAPTMRDAVLEAFAANEPDLRRVATPETLDRIIGNGLGLRLNDADFAEQIFNDISIQAISATSRTATVYDSHG